MAEQSLTTSEEVTESGWIISTPKKWELVAKAHNPKHKMIRSTKRLKVEGGYLYQVSTEGPSGYAEALQFVPTDDPPLKPQSKGQQPGIRWR